MMVNTGATDISERGFEAFITDYLITHNKYRLRTYDKYNRELCLDLDILFEFLEATQPKKLAVLKRVHGSTYQTKFGKRLFDQIKQHGVIHVLRKGVTDNDVRLDLLYDKPDSLYNTAEMKKFESNIFSISRQVHYSSKDVDLSLDMVIFVNGIPIITTELKNELTNQTVDDAVEQYQKTRNPNEELFKFARCIVHFAVDSNVIFMTTKLEGKKTVFLPFNKGYKNGAGNPSNPSGYKSAYLWENIFSPSSLVNIIENFSQIIEITDDKDTVIEKRLIFPRYHQLDAVNKLLKDAQINGAGKKYLIQHSAGSGKSNSIAWLAHQLVELFDPSATSPVFDTIIVVTDRRLLDKQIRKTIMQFKRVNGVVEAIVDGSKQLKSALEEGKKIIITTVQKFPYIVDEIGELPGNNFAIIIDEAHSSQSGNTSSKMNTTLYKKNEDTDEWVDDESETLTKEDEIVEFIKGRKMLTNASYFAFTATPKNKTLELFGIENSEGKFEPFHLYSMRQAIEERFILDVLQNYTTYQSYYAVLKKATVDPQYDSKKAQTRIRNYVEGHEFTIEKKSVTMIEHFVNSVIATKRINGKAKAMIVTSSRMRAAQYKIAFDKYLSNNNLPYKAIVAFSGTLDFAGKDVTESAMNGFPTKDIEKKLKADEYKFLIVANKYQTGFDEPLLHTMYVDKMLGGVNAVQTLSRLNRTYWPYKTEVFVLDFANSADAIQKSFLPYYEVTILSEKTDPNKLFDLRDDLDRYQIYSHDQVQAYAEKLLSNATPDELHVLLDEVADEFKNLEQHQQEEFRTKARSYVRLYAFLSQIILFENAYLEMLYLFIKNLLSKIKKREDDLVAGVLENIEIDSYRLQFQGTHQIVLEAGGELRPIGSEQEQIGTQLEMDFLSNIIKLFNDKFGTDFEDNEKVRQTLKSLAHDVANDEEYLNATKGADKQNAKIAFDAKLEEKFIDKINVVLDIYQKYNDDIEFKEFFSRKLFDMVSESIASSQMHL